MKNLIKALVFFIGGRPLMFPRLSIGGMWSPKCLEENEEEKVETKTEPESS